MSTGQLGMPEEEGLRRPLLPHSIVVVLDVVGSNPIAHPIEGCPDQGFSVMTSGSQTCEKALSGARRCHADPVEGPLSCGYGHGRVGQNCARRPRTCAARALSNDNKADARRPRSGGHARHRRTGHCRTRLEPLLPSWSASTAASNGMQPASSTTSCRQRSRRITPITSAKQTRWRAWAEYADHPFSCAVSCAQLAPRACDGDYERSAGCCGEGSGRAAGGARAAGSCWREVIASFS